MSFSTTLARAAKRSRPAKSGPAASVILPAPSMTMTCSQAVLLAELEVDRVVGRRDLDRAGAEVALDALVGDDRDGPVLERQDDPLAVEVRVALVVRVDGQGRVAEHGLRPRRGHDDGLVRRPRRGSGCARACRGRPCARSRCPRARSGSAGTG